MELAIYVNYRGTCEEAFRFYAEHLGGRMTGMVRHAEMGDPRTPPEWGQKVVHARIRIGGTVVQGADIPTAEPMRMRACTIFSPQSGGVRGSPISRWRTIPVISPPRWVA